LSLSVAVFGSSEPAAGDPLYELARDLGSRLAAAGYEVVTGGYGGVMEGASRGAHEAGGATHGVTCRIFAERAPNAFLTRTSETADLFARTAALMEADGFVVLHGRSGTLAELTWLWALSRAGSLGRRPVVLLGAWWGSFLRELVRLRMIEDGELSITRVADSPGDAVEALDRFFAAEGDRGS
jgi:uncharacterized protein (TIGR00730 family)